jgi:1-acyl-sn-glycerol-3-phosphate acyltransferase
VEVAIVGPQSASRGTHPRAAPEHDAERAVGVPLDRDDPMTRGMFAIGRLLARYHRHSVVHLDRLGKLLEQRRRVILVGNHVLDVVDPFLFVQAIYERHGVVPVAMGHRAWFSTPVLRDVTARYGVIPSRDADAAARAVRDAGLMMLFPGAIREAAMRDFASEPYRLKWEGRTGFLRLALEHDAEVVFFAAVGSEQMYYQSRLRVPEALISFLSDGNAARYRGLRLPIGMLGPHLVPGLLPFPATITHVLSEPIDLGDRERARRDEQAFAELHARVTAS